MLAANKFINVIKQRQTERFTINAAIMQYERSHTLEDTVFAVCSDASSNDNTIKVIKSKF